MQSCIDGVFLVADVLENQGSHDIDFDFFLVREEDIYDFCCGGVIGTGCFEGFFYEFA